MTKQLTRTKMSQRIKCDLFYGEDGGLQQDEKEPVYFCNEINLVNPRKSSRLFSEETELAGAHPYPLDFNCLTF